MKKFLTVALLMFAGTIHAESRVCPAMRPQVPASPAVQLPAPWPEIRTHQGNCPGGQCTGEACNCNGQGQSCQACQAFAKNAATDAPAIVALAVGQCPGGQCPVPQRSAVMGYSYPTMTQPIAPPVYTVNYSPQSVATVYAERPRLFGRLFSNERPRLFGRLFTGKLFGGGCCGK